MSDDLNTLGSLIAAATRVLSGEFSFDQALATIGNLGGPSIASIFSFLDNAIERQQDLATAYTVGELMLASMVASVDSEPRGLLAMKVAIVISLMRPDDDRRQHRRVQLHEMALGDLAAAGHVDMLGPLLYNVGNAYYGASTMDPAVRYRNAIAYYRSALQSVGDDPNRRAPIIQNLGACYIESIDGNRLAQLNEALSLFKQAAELLKTTPHDETTDYAELQVNVGLLKANSKLVARREAAKNSPVFRAIQDCLERRTTIECGLRRLRQESQGAGNLQWSTDLALEHLTFSDDQASPDLVAIGLHFIEALAGDLADPILLLKCRLYGADWSQGAGRTPEAITKLDAALAIAPSDTPWHLRFETLRRIAQYKARLRDFQSAVAYGRRALTVAAELGSVPDEYEAAMELATHMYNFFVLMQKREHCENAAVVFSQALASARRLHDPRLTMKALHLLAVAQVPHANYQNLENSRDLLKQALDLARTTKAEVEYAAILADLEKIDPESSAELSSSGDSLENAYSTANRVGDRHTAIKIAWNLGQRYKSHGRVFSSRLVHESSISNEYLSLSATWYERAINHVESMRSEMTDPHERIELLGRWRPLYHGAMGAFSVIGRLEEAIVSSDGLRARILGDIMAARDRDFEVLPPHLDAAWRRAQAALLSKQAEQIVRPGEASVSELRKASVMRDTLLFEIRANVPGFSEAFPAPRPDLRAILRELESEPDMAVVVFAQNSVGVACFLVHPSFGSSGVELVWTNLFGIWDDPNAEVHIPGPSFHFACDVGNKYSSNSDEATRSFGVLNRIDEVMNSAWHELFARVYDKLLGLGVRRLVLLPPRSHRLCPLAAMNYESGGKRYLIDDFELTLAPSLLVWLACRRRARTRTFESSFKALVDPTSDLSFARAEGKAIAELFKEKGTVLESQQATAASLYALGPSGYLHLACHGTFDMAASMEAGFAGSMESALWLAPSTGRTTRMFRGLDYDPVTSAELQGLFLDRTRLVVLSACSAGMTEFTLMNRGDEQLGLGAAFLMAGTAGVISSLWQVDDAATALLMRYFYQGLMAESSRPAKALRDAQLHVRDMSTAAAINILSGFQSLDLGRGQEVNLRLTIERLQQISQAERPYADPYYWAGFFLWGD